MLSRPYEGPYLQHQTNAIAQITVAIVTATQ